MLVVHLVLFVWPGQTYMDLVSEAQCRLPRHADVKAVIPFELRTPVALDEPICGLLILKPAYDETHSCLG